ncbi:valine--tRNA ligase [Salinisphaera sp. Q1T1-3]|uniref:valine--tRNA ligase n=1 Tax=Salinisphaera sp. Q1T1-3 TaxID=2321229 RepID=UPI000E74A8B9|nr:valine--tRNA ligase [Salinisphaera sp. Q1T1-3]RJS93776.1 valine--tRNA ligase [Salinisphaera sp. Q1T1-3]
MAELDKTFDPHAIEARWYPVWEERGYFAPDYNAPGEPYSIMLPPPNVTGSLHMGHAFQHTLMDALTRYHRMRGHPTLWQPGTDHAGIATQMLVERKLEAEGTSRTTLGRETFIDRIWDWKAESGGHITRQMRRMGASVDWSRERFTMDDGLSDAVQDTFVALYDKGLIYRGQRLVNWDPVLNTAISDLEVENMDSPGHMWHFKYPLADGAIYEYVERDADGVETFRETRDYISIATTRPETMLGDGAIAVHPDDARYAPLVGHRCEIPVGPKAQRRLIPIITDDYPDPTFGSGAVKITGAHDFNDYAVATRNDIPMYRLMDTRAHLRDDGEPYAEAAARAAAIVASGQTPDAMTVDAINLVPDDYRGLDRFAARERIVADIDAEGLMITVEDKAIMQPYGDRSGVVIEPMLTNQWFVDAKTLAKPAIAAVEDGRIRFVPGNWDKTYFEWMRNIQDWCISRQLWWGHRIPAWYDEAGHVYVARSETEVREKHGLSADVSLTRDEDVLDTWYSSGLWAFSTLGWPEHTQALSTFYPTSVLVTGFDIIFFWVARMIMMGLEFMGDVPFREVYVHGLVRDSDGAKMSKSKGNVLDPIDLIDGIDLESLVAKRTANMMQPQKAKAIEKATRRAFPDGIAAYGTDALRFTFAALASPGRDIRFDLGRVEGYRNFCNKLWNAARFALMQVPADFELPDDAAIELSAADRWIVSHLQRVEREVTTQFDAYRFDLAASAIHDFVWHHFCDWYLELIKPVLSGPASAAAKAGTQRTLVRTLETTLRLMHPLMPFITEEIWQRVAPLARGDAETAGRSISLAPFPVADEARIDPQAEAEIDWLKKVIGGLRTIRGEMDLAPKQRVPVLVAGADAADRDRLRANRAAIDFLAGVASIDELPAAEIPESAVALVGDMQLRVPLAGLIDTEAELARLDKRLTKLEKDLAGTRNRLASESFVAKAPAEVVDKARAQLLELEREHGELTEQRARIAAL